MFVTGNTLSDVKAYFNEHLSTKFSRTELQLMLKLIVCKLLKIREIEYLSGNDLLFSESDLLHVRDVVLRLQSDEPFQYILGDIEFCGVLMDCDSRGLIPRPETEELVHWLKETCSTDKKYRMMDVCAGSGCIAFGLKNYFPESSIAALEYSKDAIELIKHNVQKTGLELEVVQQDVLKEDAFSKHFEKASFDCWIANPPYIPESEKDIMHVNVLEYEPHMALFVENDDALLFYRVIGKQAREYLKPNGYLFFEMHENLADHVMQLLDDLGFVNIELRKDLQGKDRMVKAQSVFS